MRPGLLRERLQDALIMCVGGKVGAQTSLVNEVDVRTPGGAPSVYHVSLTRTISQGRPGTEVTLLLPHSRFASDAYAPFQYTRFASDAMHQANYHLLMYRGIHSVKRHGIINGCSTVEHTFYIDIFGGDNCYLHAKILYRDHSPHL